MLVPENMASELFQRLQDTELDHTSTELLIYITSVWENYGILRNF